MKKKNKSLGSKSLKPRAKQEIKKLKKAYKKGKLKFNSDQIAKGILEDLIYRYKT